MAGPEQGQKPMAFPQFDIFEMEDGKFMLARLDREADLEPDDCLHPREVVGIFDTEMDARIQLLRLVATPTVYRMPVGRKAAG